MNLEIKYSNYALRVYLDGVELMPIAADAHNGSGGFAYAHYYDGAVFQSFRGGRALIDEEQRVWSEFWLSEVGDLYRWWHQTWGIRKEREGIDLEATFARLEALIKAPATEEQVERSLRTNLAVAQRLAESGELVNAINLRAEFDRIRMLVMDLRDELAEHRRAE